MDKKMLSFEEIESQAVMALPDREMMALVNVFVVDVLNNLTANVQLPIGIAANVCGVNANVLATQLGQTGSATCTATTTSLADFMANLPGGHR